jgi:MYXO-CTERM domain-containing protein
VWVLDVSTPLDPRVLPIRPLVPTFVSPPIARDTDPSSGESATGTNRASGGCSVTPSTPSPGGELGWAFVLGLPMLAVTRRRGRPARIE